MGCNNSKVRSINNGTKANRRGKRYKTESPIQEKHNSADSKAPLTCKHAAGWAHRVTPPVDFHTSFGSDKYFDVNRAYANDSSDGEIHKSHVTMPTTSPTTHLGTKSTTATTVQGR